MVLVVEDDEDLRRLSVVLLNRMGYTTMEAADGPGALAMLAKLDHIDLLFTDLVLPGGMGGLPGGGAMPDLSSMSPKEIQKMASEMGIKLPGGGKAGGRKR